MIRKIKTLFASFVLVGLVCAGAMAPVSAEFDLFGDPCRDNPDAAVCEDSNTSQTQGDNSIYGPNGIVSTIVTILSIVIGFAATLVIIIAGIQYMLSTGDPTKVNNAKNAILYALIGLAVAVVARVVVVYIINKI